MLALIGENLEDREDERVMVAVRIVTDTVSLILKPDHRKEINE
jgi:hypothetical protein